MKPTALSDRKGFTLVEAIVAGALSVFVLLTAATIYNMNAKQISGSFSHSITGRQYQTVIDQIGAKARQATEISLANTFTYDTNASEIRSDSIFFLDSAGNKLGGYIRNGNSLFERTPADAYINFKVGNNRNVQVTNKNDGTDKPFKIAADRKRVTLNLNVFIVDGSSSVNNDTVYSKGETFECRN